MTKSKQILRQNVRVLSADFFIFIFYRFINVLLIFNFLNDRARVKAVTWWTHGLAPVGSHCCCQWAQFNQPERTRKEMDTLTRSNEALRSCIQLNNKRIFYIIFFFNSLKHGRLWLQIKTAFHNSDSSEKREDLRAVRVGVICRGNLPQMWTRSSALCRVTAVLLWQPGSRLQGIIVGCEEKQAGGGRVLDEVEGEDGM